MTAASQGKAALQRGATFVEFVGLPASGKSTVSHALAGELSMRGRPTSEPSYRLVHETSATGRLLGKASAIARTALRSPAAAVSALSLTRASGQPTPADQIATGANLLFLAGLVGRLAASPAIHILDQGPIQGIGSIWWRGRHRDEEAARAWARGVIPDTAPWWIVLVEIGEATARERIADRSFAQSRIETADGDAAQGSEWARVGDALEAAWAVAERLQRDRSGQVHCTRVSGEAAGGPDAAAGRLADLILGTEGV